MPQLIANQGQLWPNRSATPDYTGLLLQAINATNAADTSKVRLQFTCIAFDIDGTTIASADMRGAVFLLNLRLNRYHVMKRLGQAVSAMAFSPTKRCELLIALKDRSILCYNTETGALLCTLKLHHSQPIRSLAYHPNGAFSLSCSAEAVALWDMNTFSRAKTLASKTATFTKALYSPSARYVLTCFRSDIYLWHSESFEFIDKLTAPDLNNLPQQQQQRTSDSSNNTHKTTEFNIVAVAISCDERLVAAGGNLEYLFIWDIETRKLQRIIDIPPSVEPHKQQAVQKLAFNPSGTVLAAHLSEGRVIFIELDSLRAIADFRPMHADILDFDIDVRWQYIACSLSDASIQVFDIGIAIKHQAKLISAELASRDKGIKSPINYKPPARLYSTTLRDILATIDDPKDSSSALQNDYQRSSGGSPNRQQDDIVVSNEGSIFGGAQGNKRTCDTSHRSEENKPLRSASDINLDEEFANQTFASKEHSRTDDQQQSDSNDEQRLRKPLTSINTSKWTKSCARLDEGNGKTDSTGLSFKSQLMDDNFEASMQRSRRKSTTKPSKQNNSLRQGNNCMSWSDSGSELSQSAITAKLNLSSATPEERAANLKKLRSILKQFGEYPEQYRTVVWRFLLFIPENRSQFDLLIQKGLHAAVSGDSLRKRYPMSSTTLFMRLEKVLSCIAHTSPVFAASEFIAEVVFPFSKIFKADLLSSFEASLTFLANWGYDWFEFHPNPPVSLLTFVENLLDYHDSELLEHFHKHKQAAKDYAWVLLRTLFTEVLSTDEWLKLFDHVFSSQPVFLYFILISYLIQFRAALLSINHSDQFKFFFQRRNTCDVNQLIADAYRFMSTAGSLNLPTHLASFKPLSQMTERTGQYPVFNNYPKYVVDFQLQERERIAMEEDHIARTRRNTESLKRLNEQFSKEDEDWFRSQMALLEAEEKSRHDAWLHEQNLLREKLRLEAMNREERLRHVSLIEHNALRFLEQQKQLRDAKMKRIENEIQRRHFREELEIRNLKEEEDLKRLEAQAAQRLQELTIQKDMDRHMQQLQQEVSMRTQQRELESSKRRELWKLEDEELSLKRTLERDKKEKLEQLNEHLRLQSELRHDMYMKQINGDLELMQLEHSRKLQQITETELDNKKRDIEDAKKRERVLLQEEERLFNLLLQSERERKDQINSHRNEMMERENRKRALDNEIREQQIRQLELEQKKQAFETRLRELKLTNEMHAFEEERQLQRLLVGLEEQRKKDVELQNQLLEKQKSLEDAQRVNYQMILREDALIENERRKFEKLRDELRKQFLKPPIVSYGTHTQTEPQNKESPKQEEDLLSTPTTLRSTTYGTTPSSMSHVSQQSPATYASDTDSSNVQQSADDSGTNMKSFSIRRHAPTQQQKSMGDSPTVSSMRTETERSYTTPSKATTDSMTSTPTTLRSSPSPNNDRASEQYGGRQLQYQNLTVVDIGSGNTLNADAKVIPLTVTPMPTQSQQQSALSNAQASVDSSAQMQQQQQQLQLQQHTNVSGSTQRMTSSITLPSGVVMNTDAGYLPGVTAAETEIQRRFRDFIMNRGSPSSEGSGHSVPRQPASSHTANSPSAASTLSDYTNSSNSILATPMSLNTRSQLSTLPQTPSTAVSAPASTPASAPASAVTPSSALYSELSIATDSTVQNSNQHMQRQLLVQQQQQRVQSEYEAFLHSGSNNNTMLTNPSSRTVPSGGGSSVSSFSTGISQPTTVTSVLSSNYFASSSSAPSSSSTAHHFPLTSSPGSSGYARSSADSRPDLNTDSDYSSTIRSIASNSMYASTLASRQTFNNNASTVQSTITAKNIDGNPTAAASALQQLQQQLTANRQSDYNLRSREYEAMSQQTTHRNTTTSNSTANDSHSSSTLFSEGVSTPTSYSLTTGPSSTSVSFQSESYLSQPYNQHQQQHSSRESSPSSLFSFPTESMYYSPPPQQQQHN